MKLLFLTVIPSPYQRELFAAMVKDSRLEVEVLYFSMGAIDRQWGAPKLSPHERVLEGVTLTWLGASAHLNLSVVDALQQSDADLIVISDYSAPTAQIAMRYLARKKRPFVFWGEIPGFTRRGRVGTIVREILQHPLKSAAGIAGIGTKASQIYGEMFPALPVFNIPYYCDIAPFSQYRRAVDSSPKSSIDILFSGQMIERKGVDLLISAFADIALSEPRLKLTLLGGGPSLRAFEELVPKELAERVTFLGHVDSGKLPTYFANADVFCLPSRHDGWGVVVNEALGAGMPIIVSDAVGAGADLVVQNKNGYIVPNGDVVALSEALRLVAETDRRSSMAAASRCLSKRWTLNAGVDRWVAAASHILQDVWRN